MAMENEAEDELGREAESDSEIDDNVLTEKVLTEYDRTRRKVPIVRNRSIVMNTKILVTELTCPICLDLITSTMTTKLCLHRFCFDCICKSLSIGNKECPTCRSKLLSKRALRPDHNFDTLIRRICPDRNKYDEMLAIANQDGDDALYSVVAYADDLSNFGDRTHPDIYDPFDKDAPTPPALLDSRRTTSPMEMYGEGGRRTPPWFTMGQLHTKDMGEYENGIYMQTQKAYLKMKNNRLGARIAGIDRFFDCEATETYSKTSRETSSPRLEPHSKSRRINNGGSKRMIDDEKSAGSSIDSGESDSDDEGEAATVEIELDKDYIEEQEMMDNRLFLLNTSREVVKKGRTKDSREIKESSGEEGGSNISVNPATSDDSLPTFDPRINPDPPYPDMVEYFAELMPNGRGATWQSVLENSVEQPQEDDPDEEMVFDEDDVLSVVSIDDLLYEIGDVAHEDEAEKSYAEKKPDGLFTDLSREIHEEKNKYMCEETRMHIREINELRGGGLIDMKATLEDTEQFDLGEATTWYSQTREGEEIVYYEKSKQPLSRGRRPVTKEYDVDEEVERICRRVTMKDIRDDMSNTDTDRCTPCTLSLASSPISSKLTLSDANDEEMKEESPAVDLPPLNPGQVKERLHRWIGDVTPNTPEQLDTPLDRSTMDEDDDEDCESLPENYEIEAELRPSAALLSRNVPCDVLQTRFIRTQHNTTVEHIGEFLYQRWLEDVHNKTTADEVAPDVPRPEHFYVFNRVDRNCKCVFIHEPLVTAQTLTARDDHVVIYFDTQRAEINSEQMSLLEKIVPHKDRTEPTPASSRDSTGSSSSR